MKMQKSSKVSLIVALVLILQVNLVFAEEDECQEAMLQGKLDAQSSHRSVGWFVLGLPALLMSPIWLIAAPLAGYLSNPTPKTVPEEETNIVCYLEGYREVARRSNGRAALGGAAVGTAGFFVFFFLWFGGWNVFVP
jgi:hypothetical protein